MNYKNIYESIITLARMRDFNTLFYKELHHIIPRCLGGNDDKDNLVYLTAKEHYICHKLLFKSNPTNESLFYSYWMMATMKTKTQNRNYLISSKEYEILKQINSNKRKGIKRTIETKQKISKANLKLWKDMHYIEKVANSKTTDEYKTKMNFIYDSDEYKTKIKNATKKSWDNEEIKKKRIRAFKDYWNTPEAKLKRSNTSKALWQIDEYKTKIKNSFKIAHSTDNFKKSVSDNSKKRWKDENYKLMMKIKKGNPCNIFNKEFYTMQDGYKYYKETTNYTGNIIRFKKELNDGLLNGCFIINKNKEV